MCLIAFAVDSHPDYPLALIANRDEFYAWSTEKAHHWSDKNGILGGRDLKGMGTWMAMTDSGRFAAITNFRDLKNINPHAPSRGDLPVEFLMSSLNGIEFLETHEDRFSSYNGFNLLLYDGIQMVHYSNYENKINQLRPGIYGLSNALLDTPWPKVKKIKKRFTALLERDLHPTDLMEILKDETEAPDHELPKTGVPMQLEKSLSSICIRTPEYGTCSSSVVLINKNKKVDFWEKTHPTGNKVGDEIHYRYQIKEA